MPKESQNVATTKLTDKNVRKLVDINELRSKIQKITDEIGIFRAYGLRKSRELLTEQLEVEKLQDAIVNRRELAHAKINLEKAQILQQYLIIEEWVANAADRQINAKLTLYADRVDLLRRLSPANKVDSFVRNLEEALSLATIDLFQISHDDRLSGAQKMFEQEQVVRRFGEKVNGGSRFAPTDSAPRNESIVDRMTRRNKESQEIDAGYEKTLQEVDAASVSELEKIAARRELKQETELKKKALFDRG